MLTQVQSPSPSPTSRPDKAETPLDRQLRRHQRAMDGVTASEVRQWAGSPGGMPAEAVETFEAETELADWLTSQAERSQKAFNLEVEAFYGLEPGSWTLGAPLPPDLPAYL